MAANSLSLQPLLELSCARIAFELMNLDLDGMRRYLKIKPEKESEKQLKQKFAERVENESKSQKT